MASMGKIITFIFGLIVFGSLAGVGFGYLTNITTALSDYAWAGTIIVLGIVISAVYLFLPKRS